MKQDITIASANEHDDQAHESNEQSKVKMRKE
jgi:hypothetical protein